MEHSVNLHVLVIMEILCSCVVIFGYNSRSSLFKGTTGKKLQQVHVLQNTAARSKEECCVQCEITTECKSASYEATTNTCLLSDLGLTELCYTAEDHSDWTSYSRNDWLLIFRAPAGIGGDVYQSYLSRTDVTTYDVNCINLTSTGCTSNYRHPIVDSWDTAGFTKVRYSLYKDQTEAAYIEFDAIGSDMLSWFRKERVVKSTWTNIATDNFNVFSLEGIEGGTGRRFYINLNRFKGCPSDSMYTVTITWPEYPCSFDTQPTYPQFIYASTASPGYPHSNTGVDKADFIAMFVKS